ncbi:heat shock protein 70 kDa 12A [Ceratobasidium sp. AG-Ba]|nr:heat shock protein 70 kDa 12A [Ceratobasidium sp. AG-Ba]
MKAVSFGAEAQLAKHFKLHPHPSDTNVKYELKLNALPTSASLQQIYSDFMKYLLEHTHSFFEDRIMNSALIWNKYRARLEVVIAHPNGWGLREQAFLRAAFIDAGFASNPNSHLVQFVTEAEASVHFCIHHTNLNSSLQPGARFAVCDAGGSTVDTTVYSVCSTRPILKLQETRASACVQAGAIFVDLAAERHLHKTFKNAPLSDEDIEEYTARGVKDFESALKRNFRDESEDKSVEIAGSRYNNPNLRVHRGRMALPGTLIKSFFDVCVNDIISSVDQQTQAIRVSYMLLVGGFGDIALTNDSTSKAVADGAVIWNSINSVVGRAPRFSLGIEMSTYYKLSPDFRGRETRISASGDRIVRGAWGQVVTKDVVIDVEAIREPFWMKDKRKEGFKESCTIKANLTKLSGALKHRIGVHGSTYWQLDFDICMRFGGPELEAYMEWEEDGTSQKGEVTIILNSASEPGKGQIDTPPHPKYMSSSGSINAIQKPFHGPWDGKSKIVIGIDIGTTQSGVAFAFLQKGIDQIIHRVTQWPGQEAQNQQGKIPSLVWYNLDGKAVSFGAEALSYKAKEDAEDNSWQLAKHFKLHLHPSDMRSRHNLQLDPLPSGVPLRHVYRDFLGYLLKHTRSFFEDRIVDGPLIWENYHSTMEVVIAHPNGWGLREQAFLRIAAIDAGFAPTSSPHMIRFVTEAEASVHFCIYHTNLGNRLVAGTKFAVCDAGGSTVDTTVYTVLTARPVLKLEEARASSCVQAGAIFVDAAAEKYLHNTLTSASLGWEDVQDYTARGIKDFESVAKRNFCNATEDKMVEIAGTRFNNTSIRTRRGRMTIPGPVIKSFFDVCVDDISASVDQQIQGLAVTYLLLVGGFGDSPYLRQCFRTRYEPQGCQVTLTNDSTSKAVADGAVIWNVTSSVTGRAPRSSIGIEVTIPYIASSREFWGRETYVCPSGITKVDGAWSQIAAKARIIPLTPY